MMSEGLTLSQLAEKNALLVTENAALQQKLDAVDEIFGSVVKIEGYDNEYWITSNGLVFSRAFGDVRQLNPSQRGKKRNQYLFVRLPKNGELKNCPIHRMVAQHFIGEKPFPEAVINHIDGNKLNNHVSNLEWVTLSENMQHAYQNGLAGGIRHGNFKGPVCSEDGGGFGFVIFGSNQAMDAGFNDNLIRRCISKPGSKHLGHTFERFNPAQLRAGSTEGGV